MIADVSELLVNDAEEGPRVRGRVIVRSMDTIRRGLLIESLR